MGQKSVQLKQVILISVVKFNFDTQTLMNDLLNLEVVFK